MSFSYNLHLAIRCSSSAAFRSVTPKSIIYLALVKFYQGGGLPHHLLPFHL
jgi:hypothetical protein